MSIEKRQYTRINYQVPLMYEDNEEVYVGKINNISLHGIELREFPHFPQSKVFKVSFPLSQFSKLSQFSAEELPLYLTNPKHAPKVCSVHLELMRKKWDPDQIISHGSVIGGRFLHEAEEFKKQVSLFFENYLDNIQFINELLKNNPKVIENLWLRTLVQCMGIKIETDHQQAFLSLRQYLDDNF